MNKLIVICIGLGLTACASNPNKAESISTVLIKDQLVSGDQRIGVKDGNLVVQRKTMIAEDLRRLQYDVYELEDHVYGNEKYGNRGIHGVLKQCRADLAHKANGGDGKLSFLEPVDRVTTEEDEMKIGFDEKDNLVGISEEYLKDRISRFQGYKKVLFKRRDDLEQKLDVCNLELSSKKYEQKQASTDQSR